MIDELLLEVDGRVGHGLVLAWFKSCVLRLVFLDTSLQSPGQDKHFGILFIPLRPTRTENVPKCLSLSCEVQWLSENTRR